MAVLMLQYGSHLVAWLIGVILLVILSVSITYAIRISSRFTENGRTGFLADWLRWISKPHSQEHMQRVYTPKQTIDKQVESWSCPICGSNLTPSDVERIELGYSVECKYCGATLGFS